MGASLRNGGSEKKMAISQNKRGNSTEDFSDKGEMHLVMMGSGAPQGVKMNR